MRIARPRHARRWLLILAAVIIAGWLAPPFFHAGRYKRILQAGLERKLGRHVELGAVTFRLLPRPGFSIDNVVVDEDPRFGSEPFARVGRMECDLRWRSLWRSQIDCARIYLDHPSLNIVRTAQGEWNVQDFIEQRSAAGSIRAAKRQPPADTFEFEAQNARINFTLNGTKKPLVLNASDVWVRFDPARGSVDFHVAASPWRTDLSLPAPGAVDVNGTWLPGRDFAGPFQIVASTRDSLLYGWIPLFTGRNPEIYGLLNATIRASGSIKRVHVDGEARLDQLHRWESLPPVAAMPVRISFAGSWNRPQSRVLIQRLDATFADSHLHLAGEIAPLNATPQLDLVLAVQRSRAENLLAMAARLTGYRAPLTASGRVDGLLTIRGPADARQYGGIVAMHSLRIGFRRAAMFAPEVDVRVGARGLSLLPARFDAAPGIECTAQGFISPPPSNERFAGVRGALRSPEPARYYELAVSTKNSSLHELITAIRNLGAAVPRRLDARGRAAASLRLAGNAWPFSRPQLTAAMDLKDDRLLVPGLTEPITLHRVHLEVRNRNILADPVAVGIGSANFSGWIEHTGPRVAPWKFMARTPRLSLEQASLWFAVLGHQRPLPILDLIPGLRSLASRRLAGRALFASVNAIGHFESPSITFRSLALHRFRATVEVASRQARILGASFQTAGGHGKGEAQVDFGEQPAHLAGHFALSELKLQHLSGSLPPALKSVRGSAAATGRFTTQGLTLQEMSANLKGKVDVVFRRILFSGFDPLQAMARTASLGSFAPPRSPQEIPAANLTLTVANQRIIVAGTGWPLSGARLDLAGNYGFDGIANLSVHANLSHVRRPWRSAMLPAQDAAATFHFAGHLKSLALTPAFETAQVHK